MLSVIWTSAADNNDMERHAQAYVWFVWKSVSGQPNMERQRLLTCLALGKAMLGQYRQLLYLVIFCGWGITALCLTLFSLTLHLEHARCQHAG
jgi:hypothetical protein